MVYTVVHFLLQVELALQRMEEELYKERAMLLEAQDRTGVLEEELRASGARQEQLLAESVSRNVHHTKTRDKVRQRVSVVSLVSLVSVVSVVSVVSLVSVKV